MLSGRNRHLQSAIATLPSNREFAGDGGSVAVSIKLKQSMFQDHCLNKEQGIFERENRETLFKTGKRFWFIAQAGPERTPKVSNLDSKVASDLFPRKTQGRFLTLL